MQQLVKEFTKGLWTELPPFRLVLGLCPTLAVTKTADNGLGMGLAVIFVLVLSNMLISLVRDIIPKKVRIVCFIAISASLVVAVELLMQAYAYPLYQQLGIFVPLIVVNCIILGRAEAFAAKNTVQPQHRGALLPGRARHGAGLHHVPDFPRFHPRSVRGWNAVRDAGDVGGVQALLCYGRGSGRVSLPRVDPCCHESDQPLAGQAQGPGRTRKHLQRLRVLWWLLGRQIMSVFELFISAIFVNNIVLAQYLGNCPYLGCSRDKGVAVGMGSAVIFVIFMATLCTWLMQRYVLVPFELGYLQTIVFILVIAGLVQFVEMFLKKAIPPLYSALGIFLPLITTNCAVMGVTILVQREEYDLTTSLLYAVASSLVFMLALILMAGIRERLDTCRVPKALMGTPIALIMAGLMSLAFMAFKGMTS